MKIVKKPKSESSVAKKKERSVKSGKYERNNCMRLHVM